jgi:hypothetical protein
VNVWRKVERDRKKEQAAGAADAPGAVPVPPASEAAAPRVLNAKGAVPAANGAAIPLPVRKPKQ